MGKSYIYAFIQAENACTSLRFCICSDLSCGSLWSVWRSVLLPAKTSGRHFATPPFPTIQIAETSRSCNEILEKLFTFGRDKPQIFFRIVVPRILSVCRDGADAVVVYILFRIIEHYFPVMARSFYKNTLEIHDVRRARHGAAVRRAGRALARSELAPRLHGRLGGDPGALDAGVVGCLHHLVGHVRQRLDHVDSHRYYH